MLRARLRRARLMLYVDFIEINNNFPNLCRFQVSKVLKENSNKQKKNPESARNKKNAKDIQDYWLLFQVKRTANYSSVLLKWE